MVEIINISFSYQSVSFCDDFCCKSIEIRKKMITGNPCASSNDARLTAARRPVLACYKAKNRIKKTVSHPFLISLY